MYRDKIDYLFQNINFIIPKTQPYKYKKKINKLFTYTGRKWYINKIRYKPPPIQSPRLRKEAQNKGYIKPSLRKTNDNCNDCKFQIHWNNLEWFSPNKRKLKINAFCT